MIMKSFSLATIAANLLWIAGASAGAAPPIPYLETSPITILWQFNDTAVTVPRADALANAAAAAAAAVAYIEDPNGLKPVERITTETGSTVTSSFGTGNQAFFVKYLYRNVLERCANDSKARLIAAATATASATAARAAAVTARANAAAATLANDPVAAAAYTADAQADDAAAAQDDLQAAAAKSGSADNEAKIATLIRQLSDKWELTAVRRPQTTLAGVMSEDYRIFLTRIDPIQGRTIQGFDTGLRLVNNYSAPKTAETFSGGTLVKVAGTVTSYFTLEFDSMYAADPLYLLPAASRATAVDGTTYNTNGEKWQVFGGGYMTYSVRNTVGTPTAVAPTKATITGYGSWYRTAFSVTDGWEDHFAGIAPLNIKMGEVKYQRSEYLPEFFGL